MVSKGRRISFRIVAVVTALWLLAAYVFGLLEVVLMWLPWDTLTSMIDDLPAADEVHRSHFNVIGLLAWAVVVPVLAQLRHPERRVAAMLQAAGIAVLAIVLYGLSGPLSDWLVEDVAVLAPIALLAVLHPSARRFLRRPHFDRAMLSLVAVAAVPLLVSAAANGWRQWHAIAGDSHAEMEHWATVALFGLAILWCGVLGSSDHPGWRLPAWTAVLMSIDFGLHSLVFPEGASSATVVWGAATVVWGALFAVKTVRRGRAGSSPGVAVDEQVQSAA